MDITMTEDDRNKLANVRLWINGETETDVIIDMLKHHKQTIYHSTNHLKDPALDRKRNHGLLNYTNSHWISEYSNDQSELKDRNNTTIEEFDLLLSSITGRPKFLKNHLPAPKITLEKDSIADLSKRLIDLYMKEHGLKCKITVEPFESSYK